MACLMTACLEDNFTEFTPTPGIEVKLSADLNMAQTRTLYGAESNNKVPVHWVHGDTISVYGADCLSGRKQADYLVSTINPNGGATPETGNDFAFSLDKVGAYGVQWGNETTSDFYAIYPSTKGTFGEIDGKVTVTTNIRTGQKTRFVETKVGTKKEGGDSILWVGTPYINDLTNPTMRDALMYAYTPNAAATDSYGNPKKVDLKFHPFSTVLKFRISGWKGTVGTGIDAYVSRIVLKAPDGVGIAGDCTFTFDNGVPTASNGTSNTIAIYPDYLPMGEGEAVEFYAFVIPHTNQMSLNEDWTVTIETSNFGNHTFKLKPKTGGNAVLAPAKIHKINIPIRQVDLSESVELPGSNWMEYIPRNVYLSELSVPGSWYSLNETYQGRGNDLTNQFSNGIRAFHFDCRLNMPENTKYEGTEDQKKQLKLTVGNDNANIGSYTYGTELSTALETVAKLMKDKTKEYAVVVLTIAEKPMTRSGNSNRYGTVDPSLIIPRIYELLDAKKDAYNLYYKTEKQGDNVVYGIDEYTTVNDVLGKIVVKININAEAAKFIEYGSGPALVSKGSMASESDFIEGDIVRGNFVEMNTDDIYWGNTKTQMTYYYHAAQATTSSTARGQSTEGVETPTLGMRMDAIDDIIKQSQIIYNQSAHNGWYQIAIGGFKPKEWFFGSEDHAIVSRTLNNYLKEWVDDKIAGNTRDGIKLKPSPVGIVLMNHSTSNNTSTTSGNGNGKGLIESIIALNTKFTMERNHNQPEWPDGKNPYDELFNKTNSAQNTAYAIVEEDVF